MLRRRRGIAVAIAILCASASSVAVALPAAAAVVQGGALFSISDPDSGNPRVTLVEPTPAGTDGSAVTGETTNKEAPVAESPAREFTPLIMVTGLMMLVGAIYMMVRSGSSRRNTLRE